MPDQGQRLTSGFVHTFLPARVVFGAGALDRVAVEVERLALSRVLVIATNSARDAADVVEVALKDRFGGRIDGVAQHVPTGDAARARAKARESDADGIVAIGGGSAIGLAKAVALTRDGAAAVPIVAVPTTYAGSEMTPVWGETADGTKTTGTSLDVLPASVIYDPVLSQHLPAKVTAASVANALAHCVEAVWTTTADPITETIAVEAARALATGLQAVRREPANLDARSNLLYGACLAGSSLASAGTGLHHKLCHLLGGRYQLPHAETHAAVLPQVTRHNAPAVPRAKARLEEAIGTGDLATGLFDLFAESGLAINLEDLGLTESQAVDAARSFEGAANPIPVTERLVTDILRRAWSGSRPEGDRR